MSSMRRYLLNSPSVVFAALSGPIEHQRFPLLFGIVPIGSWVCSTPELRCGEPSDQLTFDTGTSASTNYIFDELGLKSYSDTGPNLGSLITHVIFHPVQKSLNRMIQVDYTIRIQSISTGI